MSAPAATQQRWLLLIHQIPPKPDYLRVKIGRRLQRVGAVPVKNSVYALPDTAQAYEDLQWVRSEILDGGGEASICRADFVDGLTNDQLRHLFRAARDADYVEIAMRARELLTDVRRPDRGAAGGRGGRHAEELDRLQKNLTSIAAIDFFAAPERAMAQAALDDIAARLQPRRTRRRPPGAATLDRRAFRKRTWVTRSDVFVDRMASAWLIRRFIDPQARFKFVAEGYRPAKGEVRFDMFEGEFTHEGDRCTFETLLARFGLSQAALRELAEVVHDIDLKDAKFARAEAPGIERLLLGVAQARSNDADRLQRSSQLFDDLFTVYSSGATSKRRAAP